MSRKPKFSKVIKVKACEDYLSGNGSLLSISKVIQCNPETLRQWILRYKKHGSKVFEPSNENRSYDKEFKQKVVSEYKSGEYSFPDLVAMHNISCNVIRNWVTKDYNGIELKNYDPKGEVYTMESRKTTFEERLNIVEWVISNDMNYKDAAEKYGVKYALIYQWVKKYNKDGEDGLKHKKRGPKAKNTVDESSLSKIEKLKLELEKEKVLRKRAEFSLEVHKKKEEFARKLRTRK